MPSKSNTTKIKAVPVNTTVIDFEDDEPSQNEAQDVLQVIENIRTEQQQPDEQEVQPFKKKRKRNQEPNQSQKQLRQMKILL